MDFKEKRALQKSMNEGISKLAAGGLSFKEKRELQKSITADLVKIGEKPVADLVGEYPPYEGGNATWQWDRFEGSDGETPKLKDFIVLKDGTKGQITEIESGIALVNDNQEPIGPYKGFLSGEQLLKKIQDNKGASGLIAERETIQTYPGADFTKLVAKQFGGGMDQSLPDAIQRYNAEMAATGSSQVAESFLKGDEGVWVKITEVKGGPGTAEGYAKATEEEPVAKGNFLAFNVNASMGKFTIFIDTESGSSPKDARSDAITIMKSEFGSGAGRVVSENGIPVKQVPSDAWQAKDASWAWFAKGYIEDTSAVTPTYDQLKAGAFINLPANEFIDKLKEAAGEIGVSDSLTMDIIDPANEWKDRREGVASEGVDPEIDYVENFLNGQGPVENELIALEDVKTKLNVGDKFKLKGKVYNIDTQESAKKKGNYNSITVEFPFNFDWGKKQNTRFTTHFTLKDDKSHPFKIDQEITLNAELREIKGKKPEKEGDTPVVYYGLNFESPEGFKKQDSEYVNFASEKSVLKHMIGSGVATESTESGKAADLALESANSGAEKPETEVAVESTAGAEGEQKEAGTDPPEGETATEGVEDEVNFDYDEDTDVNPEGDFSELAEEGLSNEAALNPDIATEKAKDVDEKLWKYAKKIVLRARFDKKPSGDNEKDNEVITGGKAWGFVQDRYQKLVSGKIKPRKKVATESVDDEVEGEEIIF